MTPLCGTEAGFGAAPYNMLLVNGLGQAGGELQLGLLPVSLDQTCSEKLRDRLHAALKTARRAASPREAQFCIREAARPIARDVFGDRLLAAARKQLAKGGLIGWNGLPIESDQQATGAEDELLTFGQALAAVVAQGTTHSFGYLQEDGGRYFQRLYPAPGLVNSGKTVEPLLPHVDNAMLAPWAQPEIIHLVCINNDAQAETDFFTVKAVLRGLLEGFGADVVSRLLEPAYLTAISNSFVNDPSSKSIMTRARPILYRRRGQGLPTRFLGKAYDMAVQPGVNDFAECERALAAFQQVLKERRDLAYTVLAAPGQGFSFNQQRLLHGRGPIVAGKYREMVRAYGRFGFSELAARIGQPPADYVFDGIQLVDR